MTPTRHGGFDPTTRRELRGEIEAQGVVVDKYLSSAPDMPVLGLNLACAYPFPESMELDYSILERKLSDLDRGVYIYPHWETHITIATFVNFAKNENPSQGLIRDLEQLAAGLISTLTPLLAKPASPAVELHYGAPVLTRKAAILPFTNPGGEIDTVRNRIRDVVENRPSLHAKLAVTGWNIPKIIHSTILRFAEQPKNLQSFLAGFDAVAAEVQPGTMQVREFVLTAETKPYMRAGKILHRFAL